MYRQRSQFSSIHDLKVSEALIVYYSPFNADALTFDTAAKIRKIYLWSARHKPKL